MRSLAITVATALTLLTNTVFAEPALVTSPLGLQYRDLHLGAGKAVGTGDTAQVHVVMWRDKNGQRGAELYNSRAERGAVSFVVGADAIMPALNEGVIGMKPGGKRMLLVPPAFAYGDKGLPEVAGPDSRFFLLLELVGSE